MLLGDKACTLPGCLPVPLVPFVRSLDACVRCLCVLWMPSLDVCAFSGCLRMPHCDCRALSACSSTHRHNQTFPALLAHSAMLSHTDYPVLIAWTSNPASTFLSDALIAIRSRINPKKVIPQINYFLVIISCES